ncbi:hypothetical protein BKA57DRAFT_462874 [Linnemannia elongata]|nr:hypothetical protein BKA57DRAFT_462874 [Linnemannia elongata]
MWHLHSICICIGTCFASEGVEVTCPVDSHSTLSSTVAVSRQGTTLLNQPRKKKVSGSMSVFSNYTGGQYLVTNVRPFFFLSF